MLRKKMRPLPCAKDEEKARKICGFACGLAARKRWRSGAKAAEIGWTACGSKLMTHEYLSPFSCCAQAMASLFFDHLLTRRSTGRSLSCNQDISARGRIDEGYEAFAFSQSFPATIRFVEHSRVPGHGQSEVASAAGTSVHGALVRTLRAQSVKSEAPPSGAPLFR